ncbi:Homeodomain GLABROUS 11, putative [Theobroma cacao]|uniref:Homeodomain GLABROUS 11, putative n=1 Tax=Theobroma cacao TaxID=3641 RepID=A0A061ELR0_THECC|nr:Homeodomain GLABROUS 11, putative [Theobroma cacao]
MDPVMGSSGSSGNEQEASDSGNGKKSFHRHTAHQISTLEAYFKECPHPDDNQRRQLSNQLGLEPKQIKFWFQNKRTQTKSQHERADNSALRAENERMKCENFAMLEALKMVICPACGGPPIGEEERQRKAVSQSESLMISIPTSSLPLPPANFTTQGMGHLPLYNYLDPKHWDNMALPYQFNGVTDVEKALMSETAASAMDELIRLLQVNEPLWAKSPSDGRYAIQRESYQKTFPRATRLRSPSARIESSKDSALVTMNAAQLVDMFLDADKWVDLFPTIVTKAKTIQLLETRMVGNKNVSLQLMYERMHILSPFVAPREFYFLRHCKQIETGLWVLVDVSYSYCFFKETSHSWKFPSGCMIQEMPNGCSKVTWVEHVEVDDKIHTHRLYRDLICGSSAYGAERWVITLQRMCERLSVSNGETEHIHDLGGVLSLPEGRRSIMRLAHRMVKSFCSILNMSGELDFPQLSEENNSGVRVSVRQSIEPGQPRGMIVSAATSLWLPLPCQSVFNLLNDEKVRFQWDVLCHGNRVKEMANISTGNTPGNCISIITPSVPSGNILMLQEMSCTESLGSMVVYAPMGIAAMHTAINSGDSSNIPILPSGFIISGDGRSELGVGANSTRSSGSLLTVAYQIMACSPSSSMELSVQSVATVNTLISSTVQRIKAVLNTFNLD